MVVEKFRNIAHKTEEVTDIIERMPRDTPRLVLWIVIWLALIMLVFGWIIKYPESISGTVTIRAQQAPARLTSPATGRIQILHANNTIVNQGEIIGYIETGVDISHFFQIDSILNNSPYEIPVSIFSEKELVLGELTNAFLKFKNSLELFNQYQISNLFAPRLKQLQHQKNGTLEQLGFLKKQFSIQSEVIEINEVNYKKDSLQFFQLNSINETQYLQSRSNYLSALQRLNSLFEDEKISRNKVDEFDIQITQLLLEQKEYELNQDMALFSTYYELKNQVNQWKHNYTFIVPFNGKMEMLGFWKNNTFIQAGEETFAIIPKENPVLAQILISSHGAGKVRTGQDVIIHLDDFPFLEYGAITGKVSSISVSTKQVEGISPQNKINSYQVTVELPEQLTTNYGTSLGFKHDIKGVAQILVKRRRLVERLFDNLKYIAHE